MKLVTPKFWLQKNLSFLSLALKPIAYLFQIVVYLKKRFTKSNQFSIPIICVGNIFLGGTGKTPVALKLYELLKKKYKKPAIIRKFYIDQFDEFNLINSQVKNAYCEKTRSEGINKAISKGCDIIILDDGFQDNSVSKDLNIICFNGKQLLGNNMTIPSGPLRESIHALKNCQIIIYNGIKNLKFEKKVKKINKNIKIFYSEYKPVNIRKLKKNNYLAFAGIGVPQNFFDLLKKNRIKVKKTISFPDHYNFRNQDLRKIINISKNNKLRLITTKKDIFRLKKIKFKKVEYLDIILKIKKEKEFTKEVLNRI